MTVGLILVELFLHQKLYGNSVFISVTSIFDFVADIGMPYNLFCCIHSSALATVVHYSAGV
jgi:hypothetical protein